MAAFSTNEFSDVAKLDELDQRRLLRAGDPQERVWAAWALGLRSLDRVARPLRHAVREVENEGTRRHYVVMLAGLHDIQTLEVLAQDDPSPAVRKTACQHLAGIATGSEALAVASLLTELVETERDADARLHILTYLLELVEVSSDVLLRLCRDSFRQIRRVAVKRVIERHLSGVGPRILVDLLRAEEDAAITTMLVDAVCVKDGPEQVLALAEAAAPARASELLSCIVSAGLEGSVRWRDLRDLAATANDGIDLQILRLLPAGGDEPDALAWLAALYADALQGCSTWRDQWSKLETAFWTRMRDAAWAPAPADAQRDLRAIQRALDQWWNDEWEIADFAEEVGMEVEELGRQIRARKALLRRAVNANPGDPPE